MDPAPPRVPHARRNLWALPLVGLVAIGGLEALGALVTRQADDFAARGRPVELVVGRVERNGDDDVADVSYEVEGTAHRWSVRTERSLAAGDRVTGYYLPEDPGRVRVDVGPAAAAHARHPFHMLSLFVALAVALGAVLSVGGTKWGGPALGGALLVPLVVASLEEEAFWVRAFGPTIAGVPSPAVALGAQLVVLGPAFFVFGSALGSLAISTGSTSRGAVLGTLVRPVAAEFRAHQRRARLALAYLVLAFAGWIAYASWRGI